MSCYEDCLISAREITKGNKEKEFTIREIRENFKKRGVEYADPTIQQNLRYLYYHDALERPHYRKNIYKMGLMGLEDEKEARREINRRLEKIEKRLGLIESKLTSEKS